VSDPRDYKLDLSASSGATQNRPTAVGGLSARPFLSIHFACCGVYQRVYRDADGKAYRGRCPRCAQPVTFAVGAGGTSARSFIVR
jgi:hypothetical protein